MSKVTVFESGTGTALAYGHSNSQPIQDLIGQGHVAEPGQHMRDENGKFLKKDFTAGGDIVLDDVRNQAAVDQANNEDTLRAKKKQAKIDLLASVGTSRTLPELNLAVDKIIETLYERP